MAYKRWKKGTVARLAKDEKGHAHETRVGPVPSRDGSDYNWTPGKGAVLPDLIDASRALGKIKTGHVMIAAYIKEYSPGSDHRIRWVGSKYGARTKAEMQYLMNRSILDGDTPSEFIEGVMGLEYHTEKVFAFSFVEVYV